MTFFNWDSQKASLNSHLEGLKGQRKAFYRHWIPESSCARKETVDTDILITSRNCDRKIMQSIRITSRSPSRIRKWNQFRWTSTKLIPVKQLELATFPQWNKGSREAASEGPAVLPRHDNSILCMVIWWIYSDTEPPQERETS